MIMIAPSPHAVCHAVRSMKREVNAVYDADLGILMLLPFAAELECRVRGSLESVLFE